MERVEYVLQSAEQEPEAALECISSINPNQIRGARDRARYALAYSEAMYYNRIDSDCDTLVTPMMHYYLYDDKHHAERARALYQYALVKFNHQELAESLFAIEEAHKSLDEIDNLKLRGLLCRTEGYIYGGEMLFQNSLESHKRSMECFEKLELPVHTLYEIFNVGRIYFHKQDFEPAFEYMSKAVALCTEYNDIELLEQSLGECCDICLCKYVVDQDSLWLNRAKEYVAILDNMKLYTLNMSHYYCYKAVIAAFDNNAERAYHFLQLAAQTENVDTNYIAQRKYWINEYFQKWEDALTDYINIQGIQNSLILNALKVPTLNYQLDIAKKNNEIEHQKSIKNKLLYITIILVILLISLVVLSLILKRSYNQQRLIERYMRTVRELSEELSLLRTNEKKELVTIFNSQYCELNKLLDVYYEHSSSSKQQMFVLRKLQETIESIRGDKKCLNEMEKYVNLQHNDIMQRLRKQCANLSDRDLRIVLYSYAGLSLRAICIFLDSKPVTISKVKYKIKIKIKESCALDADEFIRLL